MAPVNPPINPTNDPQYGGNSRAIDTPEPIRVQGVQTNQIMPHGQQIGDLSAQYEGQAKAYGMQADATASKGWGDLFANVVGIGDFLGKAGVQMVKKDIENRVYEVADKERQAYTKELEQTLSGKITPKSLLDANASMDTPELPSDLADLPDELATLQSARAAGKITKLDYQGRLLEHAKALRAQYPGFKSEIDQEFAKVTGQNPANARVNSLITAINTQAAQANSAQNKTLSFIRQNSNVPGADVVYQKFLTGEWNDAQVFTYMSKYTQQMENLKARGAIAQDKNLTREEAERGAKLDFDTIAATTVTGAADTLMLKLGIDTPQKAEELANLQQNGGIDKAKWEALNRTTADTIAGIKVQLVNQAVKNGMVTKLGGIDVVNKRIDEVMAPLKVIQERITSKEFGGLYEASREATELIDNTKRDLLKDSKAGPVFRALPVIKELGGEQYMQTMMADMAFGKDPTTSPPKAFESWFKRWKVELNTQASGRADGQTRTFNDFVTELKAKVENPAEQARMLKGMVNEVNKIGEAKVPDKVKEKLIDSAFSPGNNKFLSKIEMDSFDERGRPVSGMHSVYQKWTADSVSGEVRSLSKSHPQLWDKYTGWAQSTFSDEIVPREIETLKKYNKDPNIRIDWDTANKRFEVSKTAVPELQGKYREKLGGEGHNSAEAIANIKQYETVRASINRINSAMSNLRGMAKLEGGGDETKADAFLLRAITNAAGPEALNNIQSIPNDLINKILLGHGYANRK